MTKEPARTALYCPGNRPDRFEKARLSGADIVILDLQDSVPADQKIAALTHVVEYLSRLDDQQLKATQVRVESRFEVPSALLQFAPGIAVRVPGVEHPDDLAPWSEFREVIALVETARGIRRIDEIAASEAVSSMAIGELDLVTEIGGDHPALINHLRFELILASAAAGLPAPMMSAWTKLSDQDGLGADCELGRRMGFAGRTAVHPKQIDVIKKVFDNDHSASSAARAREVLGQHGGVALDAEGNMIDSAVLRSRKTKFEN